MSKVKSILFKAELEGHGIVNMDSGNQKFMFDSESKSHLNMGREKQFENFSFAKKTFFKNEDGSLGYKIKISADCIKKDMFKDDVISQSPKISYEDGILYSYVASPMSLIRGYMFANKKETLKRKGALVICPAVQTCNAVSYMELFSKSGEKTSNDSESNKSDSTLFKKETIGDIKYATKGSIKLKDLQFVSADQVFDRFSFNPDKYSLYKSFMGLRLNDFNSELGYYYMNKSTLNIPEFGIKLSNENVLDLVKLALKKVLSIDIQRRDAYAQVTSLKIKLVTNPLENKFNSDDNWIELKTFEDVDNLSFEIEDFYSEKDLNESKKQRELIEASYKDGLEKEKNNKKDKKDE